LSSNRNGGEELLRNAERTAAQLNADLYAVHVETLQSLFRRLAALILGIC